MHMLRTALVLSSAVLLAACSGEPSESDIRSAVDKNIAETNKAMGDFGVKAESKVHELKKVGCKEDGKNAYKCDVDIDFEMPLVGRKKAVVPMRFVKASEGWVASN